MAAPPVHGSSHFLTVKPSNENMFLKLAHLVTSHISRLEGTEEAVQCTLCYWTCSMSCPEGDVDL